MNMYLGQTERKLPDAATALRWLDRNAAQLKGGLLTSSQRDEFDDCVTALWELFLNGKR